MILATRHAGNRELRTFGADTSVAPARAAVSASGTLVDTTTAVGIPALGRAIRLVAGMGASLCLDVYEGEYADKRKVDGYPSDVFETPVAELSVFDWLYDIFASLEACENAFLLKRKTRGRVVELAPIPAAYVQGRVDKGRKVFDVPGPGNSTVTLGIEDVLHIRGHTPYGGPFGVSRITQHRDPLGVMLAAQKFEGSHFRNNARPDLAILFPHGVTKQQASEWREAWQSEYGGSDNAGKAVPLGGGATIQAIPPISMGDSQFVESKRMSVYEVGRIMDIDPRLLGEDDAGADLSAALDHFLAVQFQPRLRRVERAFKADLDLFSAKTRMYPQFEVSDLSFANAKTKSEVEHQQIQDGTLLVDEARAVRGLPELPDGAGKIPQITPVGGAPNQTAPAPADTDDNDERSSSVTVPSVELRVEQDMEPLAREMGYALAGMKEMMERFASVATGWHERATELEERRSKQAGALAAAQTEALRQVGQPNVTVNVEPTPVTVENIVNVDPTPVTVNATVREDDGPKKVTVKRNPQTGLITEALVEKE